MIVQQNTLLFWAFIVITVILTLIITNRVNIKRNKINFKNIGLIEVIIGFIIYNILFWFQEFLYFKCKISMRSEKEALSNAYDWFDFTSHKDNFDTNKGDLSEGLYDNQYDKTPEEAMENKYDSYYKWLNLSAGKTLVDLGSGYCHWINYCKKRGVIVKGVTLSQPQKTLCKKNHKINVLLDDFRHYIQTTNDKMDAVTAIGTFEHLASMGMTTEHAKNIHNEMLRNIHRILNPNGRALITIMLMNPDYPKWTIYSNVDDKNKNKNNIVTLKDKIHIYNITSFYGCGRYPTVPDYTSYVQNCFKIVKVKNYTEDYRWAGINFGDNHWQNGKIYIDTPYRFMKMILYFLTDMWFFGRINYSIMKSWYWQFGGNQKTPIYNNNKSPILANIYVLEPKQKGCLGKSNPQALKVI